MTVSISRTIDSDTPESRLAGLGFELPETRKPVGNYCGAVTTGKLVFVAGHGTFSGSVQTHQGKLGADVSIEQGYAGARNAVISALASLKAEIGDLSRVRRIVRLFGMVASTPDFHRQPEVMDGASDLLTAVFGKAGVHARSAVGFVALPFNMPIELEMVVEIE